MCVNVVSVPNIDILGEDAVLPSLRELGCFCLQKVAPRQREKCS